MHRCAMCAMLVTAQQPIDEREKKQYDLSPEQFKYHPSNVDSAKLLRMAITHDLCESIAGDITPFCNADAVASKHEKEEAAMVEIRKIVGDPLGSELFELWKEYEEQQTVEALYCKNIDKFEMMMQVKNTNDLISHNIIVQHLYIFFLTLQYIHDAFSNSN